MRARFESSSFELFDCAIVTYATHWRFRQNADRADVYGRNFVLIEDLIITLNSEQFELIRLDYALNQVKDTPVPHNLFRYIQGFLFQWKARCNYLTFWNNAEK